MKKQQDSGYFNPNMQQLKAWTIYTRTNNPVNSSGSDVASVGGAGRVGGVRVDLWGRVDGDDHLGVLCMVVPI